MLVIFHPTEVRDGVNFTKRERERERENRTVQLSEVTLLRTSAVVRKSFSNNLTGTYCADPDLEDILALSVGQSSLCRALWKNPDTIHAFICRHDRVTAVFSLSLSLSLSLAVCVCVCVCV